MSGGYRLFSSLGEQNTYRKWAEVDLSALRDNYRLLRDAAHADGTKPRTVAVVKADAYGHGAPACVKALLAEGCDFFAVAELPEAIAVRRACREAGARADVLILGYTEPTEVARLAEFRVIQTAVSEEHAHCLAARAREEGVTLCVHLAIDTGMNRIGIPAHSEQEISDAADAVARILALDGLSVTGMFTHFARADEDSPDACRLTDLQSERYAALRDLLESRGLTIPFHHICNTAATLRRASDRMDGVRLGISLYGAHPSRDVMPPVRPVMRLGTVIVHLHTLLPGEGVSYGAAFSSDTPRTVATLPIGYADGLVRAESGLSVTVNTESGARRAPIVGKICMDQCMIDVTNLGARLGDQVFLFGTDQSPLSAYAKRAGSIEYECLCLISPRVPRVYSERDCSENITKGELS